MVQKKSANTLLIVIIVLLVLMSIIGGGFAYYFLIYKAKETTTQTVKNSNSDEHHKFTISDEENENLTTIGTLYPLKTFTVNIQSPNDDGNERYLKVDISLELDNKELSKELDAKLAVITNDIIDILSSTTLEDASSEHGKEQIAVNIVNSINNMLTDGKVKNVFFTSFIIQ